MKTKFENWNEQKVRTIVCDLIDKERFEKTIVGIKPKQKRTILTWIHLDFTQPLDSIPSRGELVEDITQ
jgi:hypothetical protein